MILPKVPPKFAPLYKKDASGAMQSRLPGSTPPEKTIDDRISGPNIPAVVELEKVIIITH
jgi:hypothetical protein